MNKFERIIRKTSSKVLSDNNIDILSLSNNITDKYFDALSKKYKKTTKEEILNEVYKSFNQSFVSYLLYKNRETLRKIFIEENSITKDEDYLIFELEYIIELFYKEFIKKFERFIC